MAKVLLFTHHPELFSIPPPTTMHGRYTYSASGNKSSCVCSVVWRNKSIVQMKTTLHCLKEQGTNKFRITHLNNSIWNLCWYPSYPMFVAVSHHFPTHLMFELKAGMGEEFSFFPGLERCETKAMGP